MSGYTPWRALRDKIRQTPQTNERLERLAKWFDRVLDSDQEIYPAWCWKCRAVRNAKAGDYFLRLRCTMCDTTLEYSAKQKEE